MWGSEIKNVALAEELKWFFMFSDYSKVKKVYKSNQERWDTFKKTLGELDKLTFNSYIKVRDVYFQPDGGEMTISVVDWDRFSKVNLWEFQCGIFNESMFCYTTMFMLSF